MKNYKELLSDRMSGHIPSAVFISLDYEPIADNEIQIEGKDKIPYLDLRAMQGLTAIIDGTCRRRTLEAFRSAQNAGAARVVATYAQKRLNGEFEALEVFDSEGVLTWKK